MGGLLFHWKRNTGVGRRWGGSRGRNRNHGRREARTPLRRLHNAEGAGGENPAPLRAAGGNGGPLARGVAAGGAPLHPPSPPQRGQSGGGGPGGEGGLLPGGHPSSRPPRWRSRASVAPGQRRVPPRLAPPAAAERSGGAEPGRGATTFPEVFGGIFFLAGEPHRASPPLPPAPRLAAGLRVGAAGRSGRDRQCGARGAAVRGQGRAGQRQPSLSSPSSLPARGRGAGGPGHLRREQRPAAAGDAASSPEPLAFGLPSAPLRWLSVGGGRPHAHGCPALRVAVLPPPPSTLAGVRRRPRAVTGAAPALPPAPARRGGRGGGVGRETGRKEGLRAFPGPFTCLLRPSSRGVFPPGSRSPALPGRQQPVSGGESKFSAAGPPAPLPSLRSRRIHKLLHRRQPQRSRLYRL